METPSNQNVVIIISFESLFRHLALLIVGLSDFRPQLQVVLQTISVTS